MFRTGQELIDRSPLGDLPVRFDRYVDALHMLAVVYVHDFGRYAQVPSERLSTEPTHPWGPKPLDAAEAEGIAAVRER